MSSRKRKAVKRARKLKREAAKTIPENAQWTWGRVVMYSIIIGEMGKDVARETRTNFSPPFTAHAYREYFVNRTSRGVRVHDADGFGILTVTPCPPTPKICAMLVNLCYARLSGGGDG